MRDQHASINEEQDTIVDRQRAPAGGVDGDHGGAGAEEEADGGGSSGFTRRGSDGRGRRRLLQRLG